MQVGRDCRGSLHSSLLSARHVVRAAFPAFPRPLMRHPAFPALCEQRPTSYSGSTPPSGIASGLASLPNGLPSTPLGSVICLIRTTYCPPLATLLFTYLCCFPSPCARTICTLFACNRRRAHGPPSVVYKSELVRYLAPSRPLVSTG